MYRSNNTVYEYKSARIRKGMKYKVYETGEVCDKLTSKHIGKLEQDICRQIYDGEISRSEIDKIVIKLLVDKKNV